MLFILLTTVIIIPTFLGWGKFLENITKNQLFTGVSGKIIYGIFGISISWTVIAFFLPLNLIIEATTLVLGLFYFFKERLYKELYKVPAKRKFLMLASIAMILYCSSFYPYILDHFGYYVPSIQWLREYGLVKGISNLDLVLGQMSIWHIFQAGFSNFTDPFLRINAVLLIVYLLYIIEKKKLDSIMFSSYFTAFFPVSESGSSGDCILFNNAQ